MYQRTISDFAGAIAPVPAPEAGAPAGFCAGTLVETDAGWRKVEALRAGDRVQTWDGGLRALRQVHRARLPAHHEAVVRVPGGVLNTCEAAHLEPGQRVMLDSGLAEGLRGAPLALVRAGALVGHLGIRWQPVAGPVGLVRLVFDEEEVVYANTGLLLHCPGAAAEESFFRALHDHEAAEILGLAAG